MCPGLSVTLGIAPKTTDGHEDHLVPELGLHLPGKENCISFLGSPFSLPPKPLSLGTCPYEQGLMVNRGP